MRSLPEVEESLLHLVHEEAELRRWPEMSLNFHSDGYMTSWGPGVGPWIMVLWRADRDDLNVLLNALRAMPVPILQGFEDAGEALVIAVERSARHWAELRPTGPWQATYTDHERAEAYDAVLIAGAPILVERILVRFSLVTMLAHAWEREYRRQVADINAKREQDGSKAVPPSPSRRS